MPAERQARQPASGWRRGWGVRGAPRGRTHLATDPAASA